MSAVVEARGLVKTYGEIRAVDHVDLTVEAGDVYGYLGPNGAGKTTSLRMLLGLIRPTSRSVTPVRPGSDGRRRACPRRRGRLRRGAALLPVPLGPQEPRARRRARRRRRARADRRGARHRRPDGSRQGSGRRLLPRHAAAPRHRRRADPATAPPAARRAGHRARPRGHARHARADPIPRRQRHHRAALESPHERGRGALQPRRDHPLGPHRLRGAARRAARERRRELPAADVRRRARRADLREPAGHPRLRRRARRAAPARRRGGGRSAQPRARGRGHRAASARAGRGLARGAVLRAHGGSH